MTRFTSMVGLTLSLLALSGAGPQRDSQTTEIIVRERAALDRGDGVIRTGTSSCTPTT